MRVKRLSAVALLAGLLMVGTAIPAASVVLGNTTVGYANLTSPTLQQVTLTWVSGEPQARKAEARANAPTSGGAVVTYGSIWKEGTETARVYVTTRILAMRGKIEGPEGPSGSGTISPWFNRAGKELMWWEVP
jgi:hypothetical protein